MCVHIEREREKDSMHLSCSMHDHLLTYVRPRAKDGLTNFSDRGHGHGPKDSMSGKIVSMVTKPFGIAGFGSELRQTNTLSRALFITLSHTLRDFDETKS